MKQQFAVDYGIIHDINKQFIQKECFANPSGMYSTRLPNLLLGTKQHMHGNFCDKNIFAYVPSNRKQQNFIKLILFSSVTPVKW